MISTALALLRLFKGIIRGMGDPAFRASLMLYVTMLLSGMIGFRLLEGWDWIDAWYYSIMLLATVGPDGFALSTSASKVFAGVFALAGWGVALSFALQIGQKLLHGWPRANINETTGSINK